MIKRNIVGSVDRKKDTDSRSVQSKSTVKNILGLFEADRKKEREASAVSQEVIVDQRNPRKREDNRSLTSGQTIIVSIGTEKEDKMKETPRFFTL